MKKITLVSVCLVFFTISQAQTMARIVVSSCGNSATSGTTTLNYTVGEAVVSYLSSNGSPTYKLSQGYQQSDTAGGSVGIKKIETISKSYVNVSPNPANQSIRVSSFTEIPGALNYAVFNSFGQLCLSVSSGTILSGHNERIIDIAKLAAGSYILQVTSYNTYFVKNIPLIIVN